MARLVALAFVALLQEPPAAEELHVVAKGRLIPTLELDATFEPVEAAEYRIRLDAYQGELALLQVAAAGETVKKGDTILALDRTPIDRQIAAAENDLRVARATLEKAQAELQQGAHADALALAQAETTLRNAETELETFRKIEGPQMIKQADLSVKHAEDAIQDQLEELEQLKKMYKSEELTNATSELVVRRAERGLERSRSFLDMTKADAHVQKSVKHPQRLEAAVHAVENARSALATLKIAQALTRVQRDADLVRARAADAEQEEKLARLKRDREGFTFRAPFDGRLFYGELHHGQWTTADAVARSLVPGERLQPGPILVTLCGARSRLAADLPEASYFDVAPGMAATVRAVPLPDVALEGVVRGKSTVALNKGAAAGFEARIELSAPPAELLPGMKAKVVLRGAELKDVLLVPAHAVTASGAKHTVHVSKDGKPAPREVTPGKTDGKMIHIKSGLDAGDRVVLPK